MLQLIKTITASEIRSLNISKDSVMSYDYLYSNGQNNYYIVIDGVKRIKCENSTTQRKSFNKIKEYGFGFGEGKRMLTDEEEGLCQAAKNGENPFAFSMICANPELNGIFN